MSRPCQYLFVAIILSVINLTAFAQPPDPKPLFMEKCAMCHGPDGKAQTNMGKTIGAKDLTSKETQALTLAQVQTQIAKGKNRMPGYEGFMTDSEIAAVAKYVKTLK